MREIKFRIWDKIDKFMSGPFEVIDLAGTKRIDENLQRHSVYMQYTGLKDKNGKEIFEGDIVLYTDFGGDKNHLVVEWSENDGAFLFGWVRTDYAISKGEVVGNIYENPELLNS